MAKPIPPLRALRPYDTWHLKTKDDRGKFLKSKSYGKGLQWRGAYQDGLRHQPHTKGFTLRADADEWAQNQVALIRTTGLHVTRDRAKVTLREYMPEWLSLQDVGKSSRNTYGSINNIIGRFDIADQCVSAILEHHVQRFMLQLKAEGMKHTTRLDIFKQLKRIMDAAIEAELRVRQPCTKRARPVLLKDDEVDLDDDEDDESDVWVPETEQVWAVYDELSADMRVAFWQGAGMGLRAKEACGALIETARWDKPDYKLTQQWTQKRDREDPDKPYQPPKSRGSRRRFPVDPYVAQCLVEALDGRTSGLMLTENGRPLTYSTFHRRITDAARRAGLPVGRDGFHFHSLRHWYVSTMIAGGMDVVDLCIRVRHSKADVTYGVYAHLLNQPRGKFTLGEELQRGRREQRKQRLNLRVV
ncbi:tyrosine-type recombinase/integrase [Nocardia ninae]|uniref:Tyr recombinase domain-containing protein n=1 Tax=Nocardia ninae NBRC 108245 TaxID=1210091 RepID=A0A511MJY0_9NOCA|nr:tyrosine-type recombinase/integrase [Nocardia ninae]GEM40899.1 hypothetical protein NN4_54180 [Nocardia ninae NBRC 108245]